MCPNIPTVFIIDIYDKYCRDKVVKTFKLYGKDYCIKEVELDFGKPILSSIEENSDESIYFHLYNTIEEAEEYIEKIKNIERG